MRFEDVPDPVILEPTDVILPVTTACVCRSDQIRDCWPFTSASSPPYGSPIPSRAGRSRHRGRRYRRWLIFGDITVGRIWNADDGRADTLATIHEVTTEPRPAVEAAYRARGRPSDCLSGLGLVRAGLQPYARAASAG
ncbi:MAG: hypothetical protein ABS36_15545 [Acidobacteria bacterium SCN 69-37]|nr:MAG: hypothetical protein ABS36_15545 [Acidobacteria bacterium SCN 69-37]